MRLKVTLRVMLVLSAGDKLELQKIVKKHPNWRVRERAQSVLLLAEGKICQDVAERQGLTLQTVSATRRRWIEAGLAGLPDRARSGAPPKVSAADLERLTQWAREAPLSLPALQARHEQAGGTAIHLNTLSSVLKRAGFVWKRTRHCLKKSETRWHLPKLNKTLPS